MTRKIDAYPIPTSCPYCFSEVIYTSNKVIYGKEFGNGKCYKCTHCDAYVGVHNGTNIPLGRLANKELRELKKQAHALFDPIWKTKQKTRSEAYADLAKALGIPKEECHFGWFDQAMLLKSIAILQPKINTTEMLIEIIQYLRKDLTLTNEWGIRFIRGVLRNVKECRGLTTSQLTHIKNQHAIIKKNAESKKIV